MIGYFEDIQVGDRRELGAFTFAAEDIKKFAARFDPQRFHLDEEAGRKSLFGGLTASGWHVGCACIRLMVDEGGRRAEQARARGETVALWGPSAGFRDLRWTRPVLAGDTVSYTSVVETRRESGSRPEWGILQIRNTGANQRGDEVISFLSTVFVPRRPSA